MADGEMGSDPRDARIRRVVILVFVTVFLDLIGFGIVLPLLPLYVQSMGGNGQTVGILFGCFAATQLVATPILGRLSDRFGRRPVILLSLLGNAVSMAVFAMATSTAWLPLLFVSRMVAGATAGNLSACQAAVADITHERDRGRWMAIIGAGIGLGMVLGPFVGGVLAQYGAAIPPLAAALLAGMDFGAALIFLPETRTEAELAASRTQPSNGSWKESWERFQAMFGQNGVPLIMALYFLVFLGMTNLQVALPLLADQRFRWDETTVGYTFSLFGVSSLSVQVFLIGALSRRFADTHLLAGGAGLLCLGLGLIGLSNSEAAFLLGVISVGTGLGFANPMLAAVASRLAPADARGTVLGMAQSSGGLARAIGPVWSGYLFEAIAPSSPFLAGCVVAVLAALLALSIGERIPVAAETSKTSVDAKTPFGGQTSVPVKTSTRP